MHRQRMSGPSCWLPAKPKRPTCSSQTVNPSEAKYPLMALPGTSWCAEHSRLPEAFLEKHLRTTYASWKCSRPADAHSGHRNQKADAQVMFGLTLREEFRGKRLKGRRGSHFPISLGRNSLHLLALSVAKENLAKQRLKSWPMRCIDAYSNNNARLQ